MVPRCWDLLRQRLNVRTICRRLFKLQVESRVSRHGKWNWKFGAQRLADEERLRRMRSQSSLDR